MRLYRWWRRRRGWTWFDTYDGGDWRRTPMSKRPEEPAPKAAMDVLYSLFTRRPDLTPVEQAREALRELQGLGVDDRAEAVGLAIVGWTYDDSASMYFCGGLGVRLPEGHPHVYADREVAERKRRARSAQDRARVRHGR